MTLIGLISYKTISWIVKWTKIDEDDVSLVVLRLFGKKWFNFFCIGSFSILFCVGIVYF